MPTSDSHIIFPISDSALTIDFGNTINEAINDRVISLFQELQSSPLPGMIEAVPAYSSLTIYYDVFSLRKTVPAGQTVYNWVEEQLLERVAFTGEKSISESRVMEIPVCYDKSFGTDLELIARKKNISIQEIVDIHVSQEYRVYMLGFMPGFSYLGEVNERISMPRKSHPVIVPAGSIGIAGKQTGIYSLSCPGGWHIIGRTPLQLLRTPENSTPGGGRDEKFCLLNPGDRIRFISISKDEFANY